MRTRNPGVSQQVRRLATGHCAPATPLVQHMAQHIPGIAADQRRVRGESFTGSSMTGPAPVDLSPNQNNAFSYKIQRHFPFPSYPSGVRVHSSLHIQRYRIGVL